MQAPLANQTENPELKHVGDSLYSRGAHPKIMRTRKGEAAVRDRSLIPPLRMGSTIPSPRGCRIPGLRASATTGQRPPESLQQAPTRLCQRQLCKALAEASRPESDAGLLCMRSVHAPFAPWTLDSHLGTHPSWCYDLGGREFQPPMAATSSAAPSDQSAQGAGFGHCPNQHPVRQGRNESPSQPAPAGPPCECAIRYQPPPGSPHC